MEELFTMPMAIGPLPVWLLIGIFALLAIGMRLGFASGILAQRVYGLVTDYAIISAPLFIFMACLLERSGIARDMYSGLNVWLALNRGGIAIVTAIMAAMSGIISGEVVLLGPIALPQMLRLGYNQNLAIGTICASGSLGTMIPPSTVLIIYGLVIENSIKALFTAAFLPGFILASFFIIYIILRTQLRPHEAPLPERLPGDTTSREKLALFATLLLIILDGASASSCACWRSPPWDRPCPRKASSASSWCRRNT